MQTPTHDVLFTGGVPADTVEDVFRTLAGSVGGRALAYPDGEIGERSGWITTLAFVTWPNVDGVETGDSPLPDDHPYAPLARFRITPGTSELHVEGHLPYSGAAIESYAVFRDLREQGVIDPGVRFQISMPTAHAAVATFFPNLDDWPIAFKAFTQALQDEHRRILEVIPAEDLVIQLDYCTEVGAITGELQKLTGWFPDFTADEALAHYSSNEYLGSHLAALPDDVMLGYHICAGTYPTQPVSELPDIGLPVDIANALAANSGRRVDYFHMPVMRDIDEAYFAPLSKLDVGDSSVYLGLECNDGLPAMRQRIVDAGKYLDGFGVAHYCGYSQNAKADLPQLLDDLAAGANQLTDKQ